MFKKFRRQNPPPDPDEWITVPFRVAEAARVSIYTIGSRPEVPDAIRWWIAQWLTSYNSYLVDYMTKTYGDDIFPFLDQITREVMPDEEVSEQANGEPDSATWALWERQLNEGEGQ